MSNLVTRTISGAIFVAVIVASVLCHPVAFGVLFSLVAGLTAWEFYSIIESGNNHNRIFGTIGAVVLFACCFAIGFLNVSYTVLAVYALYIICLLIAELFRKAENPIRNWAYLLLGQTMVALPLASLNYIMFCHEDGKWLLLALFVIIWTNDTGAYCVGSLLGRHKMFPRVSPGKSWEGLVGGVIFALLAGWIFSMYVMLSDASGLNIVLWLVFALLVSSFGTLGDLTESLTKRTLGIKDSGHIIPGHGGMLDRFDSLLLAAPVIAIFLMLLNFIK